MNSPLNIESKVLTGLDDDLLLQVVIKNGEAKVFERMVRANDQDDVIRLVDDAARETGSNVTAMEQELAGHVSRARSQWQRMKGGDAQDIGGFQGKFIWSADLVKLDVRPRWLVKNVLVADQPALLGGPKKSLKTSVAIDLAISLGSGKPFLGRFEVPQRVKVAVLSGESGSATIKETALRIARAKGVELSACDVMWGFDLPRLGVDADLMALSAGLRENGINVLMVDPVYLCMLSGVQDVQANNMFSVGPLLAKVTAACQQTGTSLILVHHSTKVASMQRTLVGEPLELEDLAYSGFQEFARQWILINRRQKYEPGTGQHLLWLNLGGSVGFSGCWGIDVEEGKLDDNFNGRRWQVQVRSVDEAMKAVVRQKELAKGEKKKVKLDEVKARLRTVLRELPDGETITRLADMIGESRTPVVTEALTDMRFEGEVVVGEIIKQAGPRKQKLPAWKLKRPGSTWVGPLKDDSQADSVQVVDDENVPTVTTVAATEAAGGQGQNPETAAEEAEPSGVKEAVLAA